MAPLDSPRWILHRAHLLAMGFLFTGFASYLRQVHHIPMPPNPLWNCRLANVTLFTSMMWSTLFILSMTFERFYGIILPHKAASFNTVRKAKITIISCVTFGLLFNLPNLFYTKDNGSSCHYNILLPLFDVYYWLNFVLSFLLPFVFLLSMNVVIIHTLRTRFSKQLMIIRNQGQGQNIGQTLRIKSTERQIYVTLLLVTFGFLILTTPSKIMPLYVQTFGYGDTPTMFAVFYLFYQLSQKALYTNNGVNFFLYIMSGQKFRSDLIKLFCHCKDKTNDRVQTISHTVKTISESDGNVMCYPEPNSY